MRNHKICVSHFIMIFTLVLWSKVTSLVAQMEKSLHTMRETRVRSLGQEDPLEKEIANQSVLLPGKSYRWRSLMGYSPWGRKEPDTTERLHFLSFFLFNCCGLKQILNISEVCLYSLEKNIISKSSSLFWIIPYFALKLQYIYI